MGGRTKSYMVATQGASQDATAPAPAATKEEEPFPEATKPQRKLSKKEQEAELQTKKIDIVSVLRKFFRYYGIMKTK